MGTGPAVFDGLTGTWDDGNNWSGGTGASGVPAAGDDVVVKTAFVDVDTNTSAFSAIDIASFRVNPGIKVKLGTVAAPILFGTTTALFYGGGGPLCSFGGTAVTTATFEGTGGQFVLASATWTTVYALAGTVSIGTNAPVTTLHVAGATVDDATNATAYTTVNVQAGTFYQKRNAGTENVYGGKVYGKNTVAFTTKLNVYEGGYYSHMSSGTIASLEVFRLGQFSSQNAPYSFTITASQLWRGASFNVGTPGIVITYTGATTYIGSFLGNNVP